MRYPETGKEKSEGFDHIKMKSFGSAKHQKQIQKIKYTPEKPILSTHPTVHKEQLQSNLKNEHRGRKMGSVHYEEIRTRNA